MTLPTANRRTLTLGSCQIEYLGNDDTQLLGVVGQPVSHSLSPRMQQAALDRAGRNATYVAMEVRPDSLASFVQSARRSPVRLRGFNVTVPHKSAVVALLDAVSPTASLSGAVNTVVIDAHDGFQGDNTDVVGLQAVWQENNIVLRDRRLVIVGAGGLARACVVAALQEAVGEICVLNRNVGRAQAMLDEIATRWQGHFPRCRCAAWGEDIGAWLADAAALVQATPVGMRADDPQPVSLEAASQQMFVLESLYGAPTQLLQQALQRGLQGVDGRSLLLAQGAASWRLWMQEEPDLAVMRSTLDL